MDLCYNAFGLDRMLKTDLETTYKRIKSWEELHFSLRYLHSSVEQNAGKLNIDITTVKGQSESIYTLFDSPSLKHYHVFLNLMLDLS